MASEDRSASVTEALRTMILEETAAIVRAGRATLEIGDETWVDVRPARSTAIAFDFGLVDDTEITFSLTPPGTDRSLAVDVLDKDPARLVEACRRYVRAILAGRVEFTLRKDSSAGRVRLWLEDGSERTHLYNLILSFRVGRGPAWERVSADPY